MIEEYFDVLQRVLGDEERFMQDVESHWQLERLRSEWLPLEPPAKFVEWKRQQLALGTPDLKSGSVYGT